jgi:hypothetical protein
MIFHHTKYLEIHGVDEGFYDEKDTHGFNHWLLRRYHRCEIPIPDLREISNRARARRRSGKPCTVVEPVYCPEFYLWSAWRLFRRFERCNRVVEIG